MFPAFSALVFTCHSYAETMDDEPDVMNDTALRSVVRWLQSVLIHLNRAAPHAFRDFSSSAHSASQQSRTSITPASSAKVPVLAAPVSNKLSAGTAPIVLNVDANAPRCVPHRYGRRLTRTEPGSKPLKMDATDFED